MKTGYYAKRDDGLLNLFSSQSKANMWAAYQKAKGYKVECYSKPIEKAAYDYLIATNA